MIGLGLSNSNNSYSAVLVHPLASVAVTIYVLDSETVITAEVSPVFHSKFVALVLTASSETVFPSHKPDGPMILTFTSLLKIYSNVRITFAPICVGDCYTVSARFCHLYRGWSFRLYSTQQNRKVDPMQVARYHRKHFQFERSKVPGQLIR